MIHRNSQVAIVAGNRLGDGLILNLIHYNLVLNGYKVVFFNSPLLSLQEWFPWAQIEPHFEQRETTEKLKGFDTVIFQHPNRHALEPASSVAQQRLVLYGEPLYMQKKPLLDIYFETCKDLLNLPKVVRSNGLMIPKSLHYRKYAQRVIIHPETARIEKMWPKEKFIETATSLRDKGYEPHFVVSPQEQHKWTDLFEKGFKLHAYEDLKDVAHLIYESGFMIGNDSGIAHLASNLGIPTLALFIRPGVAKRWRPAFSKSYPLMPWLHLPGPKLKEKYWKQLLSTKRVLKRFEKVSKTFLKKSTPGI